MALIKWDQSGEHFYETGVKNGVLYIPVTTTSSSTTTTTWKGYAWNGLTGVTESPSGAEATSLYADDIKYLNLYSAEEFGCTIEAYTYPDEFMECDGSRILGTPGSSATTTGVNIGQQERKTFALCYRTKIGNDADLDAYKLHIVYGCKASPSERAYATINDSPEAITFSWEVTTIPVEVTGYKPTSLLTLDSRYVNSTKMTTILGKLYGTDPDPETPSSQGTDPVLQFPNDILNILNTEG